LINQIIVKNKYEGKYKAEGYFGHPSSPRAIDKDKALATTGVSSVSMELGDLAPSSMVINVNADKTITLVSADVGGTILFTDADSGKAYTGNIGVHPWSYYDNMYHEDTKSFRLRYGYQGATGWRTVTEELTLE